MSQTLRRVRPLAVVLALTTLVVAAFTLLVSYGLSREYGDASAPAGEAAVDAFSFFGVGAAFVVLLAVATATLARRSAGRRVMVGLVAVGAVATVVGVPVTGVVGTQRKFAAMDRVPDCAQGFTSGPAVPVTRAADRSFAELDHPGRFGGGGGSGFDGCEYGLVVRGEVDVPAAYERTLADHGWTVADRTDGRLTATRADQGFRLRSEGSSWMVWIGPRRER